MVASHHAIYKPTTKCLWCGVSMSVGRQLYCSTRCHSIKLKVGRVTSLQRETELMIEPPKIKSYLSIRSQNRKVRRSKVPAFYTDSSWLEKSKQSIACITKKYGVKNPLAKAPVTITHSQDNY